MENHSKRAPSKNKTCQSSPEDWFERRQRSVDNQHEAPPKTHIYNSSSCQTSKSTNLKARTVLKEGLNKHMGKIMKDNRAEPSSQDKRISRRSTDRGYRGTKPSSNPAERAKTAITSVSTFEMKLADFPELGDFTPSSPAGASLHQEPSVCAGAVMPAERQTSPAPLYKDEEEFPDLSLAFEVKGHSMSQKEGSSLHSEMKHKATKPSSASTDTKKTQQTSQKKSKVPVQLDLGNMLAFLEQKQQSQKSKQDQRPVTLTVGGALPVVHKEPSVQKKQWQQEKTPHNPLDSTCPSVKKGKQREVPKAKKPTPLKRVILREREERKQNRLLEERDPSRVATEAGEKETSENPSEASLPEQEHLESNADDNAEDIGVKDSEIEQPASPSDDKLDDGLSENPTLQTEIPNSNPISKVPKIHSRKFRDYCNQVLSKDVDECVSNLLKELVRFQDRLYQKDPMKARMKRRLVMGLREVLKHLKLKKVKCVIISPNCERIQSKGGLDEALHNIIDTCRDQSVPFVFALSRKALGRCVNKAVPVSLVGIFNYDGAQDHYHKMIELSAEARKSYEVMIANLDGDSQEDLQEDQQEEEPPGETSGTEEPEYIKIWKKMLEKGYSHPFLNFEDQFSSLSIGSEQLLDDEGS
uniref:SECIS binding protein 2 isoform 3 n=1 Tax=Danio rerio TaxID=7955 RepID=UPI003F7B58D8